MFCPKCGKELPEGSLFCPACGGKVKAVEQSSPKQDSPSVPNPCPVDKPRLAQEDGVCPQCGSRDCEIHVVGSATNYSGVWVCKKCGNQSPTRKSMISGFIVAMAMFCGILISLILLVAGLLIDGSWPLAIFLIALAVSISYLIQFVIKKNLGEGPLQQVLTNGLLTKQECNSLKKSCIWAGVIAAILTFPVMFLLAAF